MTVTNSLQTQVQYEQGRPVLHLHLRASQTLQERVDALVREIEGHRSLSSEARRMARRVINQHPTPQALTYIFLHIVAPAFEKQPGVMADLFDRAADLYEQHGDPRAFLEEKVDLEEESEKLREELEDWQEGIASQLEEERDKREAAAAQVEGRVQEAIQYTHVQALAAVALADRIEDAEKELTVGLEQVEKIICLTKRVR